jgi:hypothetical protein
MKMIVEYMEKAIQFEGMAAEAKDAKLKAEPEAQAKAYRKLAKERAEREGLPLPPQSS